MSLRIRTSGSSKQEPVFELLDELAPDFVDLGTLRAAAPAAVRAMEQAHLDAQRQLPRSCTSDLRSRVASVLLTAHVAGTRERRQAELEDGAVAFVECVAQRLDRDARRRYIVGLLVAVALSLLLLALIAKVATPQVIGSFSGRERLSAGEYWALRDVLVAVGGGAAGAVLSVLLRLSHTARLPMAVSNWFVVAVVRVSLGWFFAAALVFLLKSGLIDLVALPRYVNGVPVPGVVTSSWFFWGALGFLAGFNERWAKDLLTREPSDPSPAPSPAPNAPSPNAPSGAGGPPPPPPTPPPTTHPAPVPSSLATERERRDANGHGAVSSSRASAGAGADGGGVAPRGRKRMPVTTPAQPRAVPPADGRHTT